MDGNGQPSPASHISRSDYVNLVARYYIRAITEVTRVKAAARADAQSANAGKWCIVPNRIFLSPAQEQQIRIPCLAFTTVLQYAPQYNVSEAEINEIVRYLDGRMNLGVAEGGDAEMAVQQRVTHSGHGTRDGGSSYGQGPAFGAGAASTSTSTSASDPQRPPSVPWTDQSRIPSRSQSPTAIIRTNHPPPHQTSLHHTNGRPPGPSPGYTAPTEFSALAGAAVPTPEQTENNLRRRSSSGQGRAAEMYERRESGLAGALIPVRQRGSSGDAQASSFPGVYSSGYQIPSVSPLQTSVGSFTTPTPTPTPTPPLGSGISPTLSASAGERFPSPTSTSWPDQPSAGTSFSPTQAAADSFPKLATGRTRQRSSLQGILNTPPPQDPVPAPSAAPIANHNSGPNKRVRRIAVSSNGQVTGRKSTAAAQTSTTNGVPPADAQEVGTSPIPLTDATLRLLQQRQLSALKAASRRPDSGGEGAGRAVGNGTSVTSVRSQEKEISVVGAEVPRNGGRVLKVYSDTATTAAPTASHPSSPNPTTTPRTDPQSLPVPDTAQAFPSSLKSVSNQQQDLSLMIARKARASDGARPLPEPSEPQPVEPSTETPAAPAPPTAAAEPGPIISLLSFEFKPPSKPIPSLPDWLAGTSRGEKRGNARPSLPEWANGSGRAGGGRAVSPDVQSKRRKVDDLGSGWHGETRERSTSARETADIDGSSHGRPSIPAAGLSTSVPAREISSLEEHPLRETRGEVEEFGGARQQDILGLNGESLDRAEGRPPANDVSPVHTSTSGDHPTASDETGAYDVAVKVRPPTLHDSPTSISPLPTHPCSPTQATTIQDDDVEMLDTSAMSPAHDLPASSSTHLQAEGNTAAAQAEVVVPPSGSTTATDAGQPLASEKFADVVPETSIASNDRQTTAALPGPSTPTETLKERRTVPRQSSAQQAWPVVHPISTEITFEDIVQWQRKVWRPCFCDWEGCGAILNDWDSLEKHIVLVHIKRQRPRPRPNMAIQSSNSVSTSGRDPLVNNSQQLLRRTNTGGFTDRQMSVDDDDKDPIALLSATTRARSTPIRLTIGSSLIRYPYNDFHEIQEANPEKIWLPYICRYGDCAFRSAASVAFANTETLKKHFDGQHLEVNGNKGFPSCVVHDCPYTFSEAFSTIAQSHRHVRTHPPSALAHMQHAMDLRGTAPSTTLTPLPKTPVPTCLISCPPVINGPKAPVEALIRALAETQTLWDSQWDMSFRTAFGFVPASHSDPAMDGAPIPAFDMHAQNTPSSVRSVFNPIPEYTLCTPRHPASRKSWHRQPVTMSLGPAKIREKIVTARCNLTKLAEEEDEKLRIVMTRDYATAVAEQERRGPRRVALEDPEQIPEGSEREWPLRGTIGPGYYLAHPPAT